MRSLRRLLVALTPLALMAAGAPGAAAAPITVDTVDLLGGPRALTAPAAVERSCLARPLSAGDPGVVVKTVTAGIDGFVDARLHGAPKGDDWDLAVFDALTGKLVDASAAFGGNEVIRAPVATGQRLTVQACRYGGSGSPVALSVDEIVVGGTLPPVVTQSLVLLHPRSQNDVDRLQAAGIDLNETGNDEGIYAVLHGREDKRTLAALGIPYETTVPDLAKADAERLEEGRLGARAATVLPSGRTSYRHLADYQMDLKALVAAHRGVVRPVVFNHTSVEGRTVEGVEIATDVARTDDGRPTVFQLGLHHVREWSSGEVSMEYGIDLFKPDDAADGTRKQKLLDGERTFLFPVINPDGLVASQQAGDYVPSDDDSSVVGIGPTIALAATGQGSYRRKNCANDPASGVPATAPCSLQSGVDLNRNYGAFWGGPGESDSFMDQTFRGPSPFSEPEAQNFHEFSSSHQVMVVNSNHNFAGDVLYQPGFNRKDEPGLPKGTKVPYQGAMKAVAKDAATAAGYVDLVSYELYDVTGATEDWNYFAQGSFGYTTEVGYDNFHPNYTDAVIDQYLGTITGMSNTENARKPSMGVREAMLRFGEAGLDPDYHSQITGRAPAGRILRLTKDFTTTTSKVLTNPDAANETEGPALQLPEHLETTLTVPASGRYSWAVNPSTRPLELLAGRTEAWTMTCEDASGTVLDRREVTVALGAVSSQDFDCTKAATTTPADSTTLGGSITPGASTTPGASATPAGSTTTGPGTSTPGMSSLRISRPKFSARRTSRLGKVNIYLRLQGGTLKGVRASIRDARGRLLLAGKRSSLSRSGRIAMQRRARLRTGKVRVHVTARDATGQHVSVYRTTRITR